MTESILKSSVIIIVIIILIFHGISCPVSARSYDSLNHSWGAYYHYTVSSHTVDFSNLFDKNSAYEPFKSSVSAGFALGAFYTYPLMQNLSATVKVNYSSFNADFSSLHKTVVSLNGVPADGVFEFSMNAAFSQLAIIPQISYNIWGGLNLSVGTNFGAVTSFSMDQLETIIEPKGWGTFLDSLGNDTHSRTRNEFSGTLPDFASFYMALVPGLSYQLPLNSGKTLFLVPEAYYQIGLNNLVADHNWSLNNFNFGLAVEYCPEVVIPPPPIKEIFKERIIIDTLRLASKNIKEDIFAMGISNAFVDTVLKDYTRTISHTIFRTDTLTVALLPELRAQIKALPLNDAEEQISADSFVIEEFISASSYPMLNYVFFDSNSSAVPLRYNSLKKQETTDFAEHKLKHYKKFQIYLNMLNIIGKRLNDNKKSSITLNAVYTDESNSNETRDLAERRAKTVKDYFVNIWQINSNRIKIKAEKLNTSATDDKDKDLITEELRRVEIISDNWNITKPVFIEDTMRIASSPKIKFIPEIYSEAGIANWMITASQGADVLRVFEGSDSIPNSILWKINEDINTTQKNELPIVYSLSVEDKFGNTYNTEEIQLPVKFVTIRQKEKDGVEDKIISRYSLILFDFGKSSIDSKNLKIIDAIRKRVKKGSSIYITGYTDRIGNDEYNQKLSEQRARSASQALKINVDDVKGVGGKKLLFDNNLPEGRFFCRTVEIIIETPVER